MPLDIESNDSLSIEAFAFSTTASSSRPMRFRKNSGPSIEFRCGAYYPGLIQAAKVALHHFRQWQHS